MVSNFAYTLILTALASSRYANYYLNNKIDPSKWYIKVNSRISAFLMLVSEKSQRLQIINEQFE